MRTSERKQKKVRSKDQAVVVMGGRHKREDGRRGQRGNYQQEKAAVEVEIGQQLD